MRLLLLFLFLALVGNAATTVGVDYASRYAFRGIALADDSIQPTVNVQLGAIYATAWANRPIRSSQDSEIDYTVGAGAGGVDFGVTAYSYPDGGKTTWEPFIGYSREIGGAKLAGYAFRDATLHITTFELRASRKIATLERVELSAEGVLGNSRGRDLPGYSYWSVGPTLRYTGSDRFNVSVGAQYTSGERLPATWVGRTGISYVF